MGLGMALSMSSSLSASARQASLQASYQLRQQDMAALKSAINSGDLNSAQLAYSTLTQNTPNLNANSPLAKLGQELSTGNLTQAQKQLASWGAKPIATGNSSDLGTNSNNPNSALANALMKSFGALGSNTNKLQSDQVNKAAYAFMQNLMALAIQQRNSSPSPATQANTAPSQSAVVSEAFASAKSKSSGKAMGHHHGGGYGGGKGSSTSNPSSNASTTSPLSDLLSTLTSITSMSNSNGENTSENPQPQSQNKDSTAQPNANNSQLSTGVIATPDSLGSLNQSFQTLVSTLGVNPQNASMSSFISALGQNLENLPASGNFINVTA